MIKELLLLPRLLILKLIRLYQKFFSPDHGLISLFYPTIGVCKFRPTCSEYAYLTVKNQGLIIGAFRSLKRIFRCHPWSQGGWDPPY